MTALTASILRRHARFICRSMVDDPRAATGLELGAFAFHNPAIADVVGERLEQIFIHGFDQAHDLDHDPEALPLAAVTYLEDALSQLLGGEGCQPAIGEHPARWPFRDLFRPADPRANLVKAAAFILAAIDRLDNALPDATEGEAA